MLELKNVTYKIRDEKTNTDKTVLKDISITFPDNKLTVITGQNGSGKSTLIKLIMGIISPTSGEIFYNGKNITNLSLNERASLGLTIAFQQPVRFKGLTVKNLLDVARIKMLCMSKGITKVSQKENNIIFFFDATKFNMEIVDKLIEKYRNRIKFSPGREPYITYKMVNDVLPEVKEFLKNC